MVAVDMHLIPVSTGCKDELGCLALVNGKLLAVLVRLDDPMHGKDQGKWFLETILDGRRGRTMTFATLGELEWWIRRGLPSQADPMEFGLSPLKELSTDRPDEPGG